MGAESLKMKLLKPILARFRVSTTNVEMQAADYISSQLQIVLQKRLRACLGMFLEVVMRRETSHTTARFGGMYVMAMFRNELIMCGCQCFGSVYHLFVFV